MHVTAIRGRFQLGLPCLAAFLLLGSALSACDGGSGSPTEPGEQRFSFSFEGGFEGWEPNGLDLEAPGGGGELEWSIEPSSAQAANGERSLRLFLANWNDAGKIWVERPFPAEPGRRYRVRLVYAFASADWGDANLWERLAGATPGRPGSFGDLTVHGDTANGAGEPVGHRWLLYEQDAEVSAGASDRIWVHLGVWGTWETPREYYLDAVEVRILPL